ncbi:hypothetical protein NUH30_00910 [Leptospira sp. 85282-16]|uniref:DUF8201 domain-containing protein n=1 Tax=Leptospira montravelensis TaxID=2484961 RepID=A0ABY2LTG6_9LEPT|nr:MULTISPECIES: hypothetical protein [Leptospira]MCT8332222.1 hypothetical protein [Leptospira sp. 85282-16]TGK83457.1 hypothetical protein EHQ19_02665 [Leptospira montravelensis]TGL05459.1 hypothetical protein EHQ31_01700 [Leptospira montravelensis]
MKVASIILLVLLSILNVLPHLSQDLSPYDTGLYHQHIVEIIKQEGLIIGSANLHDRIGFNNSNFYLVAVLEKLIPFVPGHYLLNPLIYFGTIAYLISLIFYLPRHKIAYKIIALGVIVSISLHPLFIVSISPDTIAYCLSIVFVFKILLKAPGSSLFSEFLLFALLVTIKFSSIFLAFMFVPFFLGRNRRLYFNKFYEYILICLVVIAPWILSNYLISGYIVYPVLQFDFLSPEWKLPLSLAQSHMETIKSWALSQGLGNSNYNNVWQYCLTWYETYSVNNIHASFYLIDLYKITFPILIFYLLGLLKSAERNLRLYEFVLALFLINITWFFSAPDPRFSYATLMIFPFMVFSFSFLNFFKRKSAALNKIIIFLSILFSIVRIFHIDFQFIDKIKIPKIQTEGNWVPTKYGFVTFEPKAEQCWDVSIFCNPYKNRNLKLIDGDWKVIIEK